MPKDEELVEDVFDEGRISISKDVISTIAGLAATEVPGVAPPKPGSMPKGEAVRRLVETEILGGRVKLSLKVGVLYGYPVQEVADELQLKVKEAVEKMTALPVDEVDVEIVRLAFKEGGEEKKER